MSRKRALGLFGDATTANEHVAERRALLRTWSQDYKAFLQARDVDGTPMIVTQDEFADAGQKFKAFPTAAEKPYLYALADELMGPQQITLIDKSRQMMVSTLCMLLLYWSVLFQSGTKCLLSKQQRELAEVLLEDKVRSTHRRAPEWFQEALPLSMTPKTIATAGRTGSQIFCVSQNAASTWFKGNTASITLIDEAAVQEFLSDMLEAAQPMSRRIWVPTTAYHGNPGATKFRELASAA